VNKVWCAVVRFSPAAAHLRRESVVLGIVSGHHAAAAVCLVTNLIVYAMIVVRTFAIVQQQLTKTFFLKTSVRTNYPLNVMVVAKIYAA
jgi:hypothetical protein